MNRFAFELATWCAWFTLLPLAYYSRRRARDARRSAWESRKWYLRSLRAVARAQRARAEAARAADRAAQTVNQRTARLAASWDCPPGGGTP